MTKTIPANGSSAWAPGRSACAAQNWGRAVWLLLMLGLYLWPGAARADSTVTNCTADALAAAIAGGGSVVFTQDCSMVLSSPLTIATTVSIDGNGHTVILSGNNTNRLFEAQAGANLTLRNLTLTAGQSTNGGALLVQPGAQVLLTNCVVAGNRAQGIAGVDASAATGTGNVGDSGGPGTAGSPAAGGAVWNLGTLTILGCEFQTNSALGGTGGNGGDGATGIYRGGNGGNGGRAAPAFGGAIANLGTLFASQSTFSGNLVQGGDGGAGGAAGSGDFASRAGNGSAGESGYGAAIYNTQSVAIVACLFNGNTATGGSGAAGGTAYSGNGATGFRGGDGVGGAIYNLGVCGVTNTTFFNGLAAGGTGGTGGDGGILAGRGGDGGNGLGGGICNVRTSYVASCTFATNAALGGTNGPAGTGSYPRSHGKTGIARGGALARKAGKLIVLNSILANSPSGANVYGSLIDAGHNLSSDRTPSLKNRSRQKTDPKLGPLADNGGPTLTVAAYGNSPARDAADPTTSPPTDQRGAPRPVGAGPDIGAFEISPPILLTQPQSLALSNGSPAQFSFNAITQPPVSYQWLVNGSNVDGATSAILSFPSVTVSNAGNYVAVLSTGFGVVTTAVANLSVLSFFPVIVLQPAGAVVLTNQPVSFTVSASGSDPLGYQWRFNSNLLAGANLGSYNIAQAQLSNAGFYDVIVTNPIGAVTSSPALLRISPGGQILPPDPNNNLIFPAHPGFTYVIQFKTNLSQTNWLTLSTNIIGAEGTITNRDATATNSSRFYRVLVF